MQVLEVATTGTASAVGDDEEKRGAVTVSSIGSTAPGLVSGATETVDPLSVILETNWPSPTCSDWYHSKRS